MKPKSKYPETIDYHAKSVWDGETGCTSYVTDNRKVVIDTPKTYNGRGEGICPDELFVSAILGCLNNTFLDFQRRFEMELLSLELDGQATAEFDGSGYKIARVKVLGEIVVAQGEIDVGERCSELMKEYCHISRSIVSCIPIEYDITVREKS
ncbi:MAG: OsmC family protein [Candidatus Thorarchaeota archaeon]